jgi:hypothetical protein
VTALLTILLLVASSCFAQSPPAETAPTASAPQRPAYNLDRSEEDWKFLQNRSRREDFWDPLKFIPLGRDNWYVTMAGEIRPFYEIYHNYSWGTGPQTPNGYYLQRIMGSTDFHLGDRSRVFVELRSGDVYGRNGGPRPSQDKDTLDVSQAFAGLTVIPGDDKPKLELKLGRQELNYGEGSLLAIRELNVRRTFDGVKSVIRPSDWRICLQADAHQTRGIRRRDRFIAGALGRLGHPADQEAIFLEAGGCLLSRVGPEAGPFRAGHGERTAPYSWGGSSCAKGRFQHVQ